MKVLAIYPGHNATVAFSENGKIVYMFHEESINNKKNFLGFPVQALDKLHSYVDLSNVDIVLFPSNFQLMVCTPNQKNLFENLSYDGVIRRFYNWLEYKSQSKKLFNIIRNTILEKSVSPSAWDAINSYLESEYGIVKEKILKSDHHLCHALTPLLFYDGTNSKTDKLLITMDGAGDGFFSKVYHYQSKENSIELISQSKYYSSLGFIYSRATSFLGMKRNEHEYKVMGLAAYVNDEKYYIHIYNKLREVIWIEKDTVTFNSKFNTSNIDLFFKDSFCGERFDNIAAAVQKLTEDLVQEYISLLIKKTGIRNIMLSGGVFMNVKMNQKIIEMPEIEQVYFQPSSGDDSLVLGAIGNYFLNEKKFHESVKTMYLGHDFTNQEISKFLQDQNYDQKYKVEFYEDIEYKIAELLSEFKIVARFKGKSEWGARSLCSRAILGNASDLKTFYEVNDLIKMRDFWMPFAPAILDSWADKYIVDWSMIKKKAFESTKYMIITSKATNLGQEHLRAAIHQKDKTLRPQIVEQSDNKDLYQLLKYFEKITGLGGIMNTSFNLHGSPLASTLEQAMFTFENSGLRYLALENYLVTKIKDKD